MRQRLNAVSCLLAAAAALAAMPGPARAQAPDPRLYARPAPDDSPTAFACSLETLLADRTCFFESRAARSSKPREQARENARRAAALADDACARAARPPGLPAADPAVAGVCKKEFVAAAQACGGEGDYPLLDAEDRFSDAAKPCYRLMVESLARVRLMAAATAGCCRCLAQTRCGKSPEQCNRQLARGAVSFATPCLDACAEECRSFVPDRGPGGATVGPRPSAGGPAAESDSAHVHTPGVRPRPDDRDDHVYTPQDATIVVPAKRHAP
jgi:hypothetical protein